MKLKIIFMSTMIISSSISTAVYALKLKSQPNNSIELLFFHEADTGLIKSNSNHCYDLILHNVSNTVLYFSNSPSRVTGQLTNAQYVTTLAHDQNVDKIEPNAVINMRIGKNNLSPLNIIGSLSNAWYKNKNFHYTLCPLNPNQMIKEGKVRNVNLFVDPIHRWPP